MLTISSASLHLIYVEVAEVAAHESPAAVTWFFVRSVENPVPVITRLAPLDPPLWIFTPVIEGATRS